jgi:hypothetical protein
LPSGCSTGAKLNLHAREVALYAQDHWSLLLVFEAIDAAGKDGTIKHVMSGVNPQGCQVFYFKQPSSEDLDHDFMWRYVSAAIGRRIAAPKQSLVISLAEEKRKRAAGSEAIENIGGPGRTRTSNQTVMSGRL